MHAYPTTLPRIRRSVLLQVSARLSPLPLFGCVIAVSLAPLHGQVTVEVVEKADSSLESTDLLWGVAPAAVRGGNVV